MPPSVTISSHSEAYLPKVAAPGDGARPGGATGAAHRVERLQPGEHRDFTTVLEAIGREIDQGEQAVRAALAGDHRQLDAGRLIALQAGIYRYAESVDLAAKLVDRAASALRTTLQSSG